MGDSNAIEGHLRTIIATHGPGTKLPSVRSLQSQFSAGPATIQRIIQRLSTEGLVSARPGDGTYVTTRESRDTQRDSLHQGAGRPANQPDMSWQTVALGSAVVSPVGLEHLTTITSASTLLLDSGFPDPSLQLHDLLAKFTTRVAKRSDSWDRCLPEGLLALRTLIARDLGSGFDADDVIITAGAQSAISIAFRTLVQAGDSVAFEDVSYPGAIAAASLAGLNVLPVPTDEHGVKPSALSSVLRRRNVRLLFLQTRHANPTGTSLAQHRRRDVLQAAQDAGVFVIEDDWVRDLDLESDSPSLPPLCTDDQHGHVLYIRSFSKVTAPGLRVGAIVCRGPVAARLRRARMFTDFFVPPLLQAVLVEVLQSPDYRRHLERLRLELRTRRDAFLDVIDSRDGGSHGIRCVRPAGGVAAWLSLKERTNEAAFVDACAARGVRVSAGAPFWTSEPQGAHIRVSFASAPAKDLALAAQRIIDVSQKL